MYVYVCVLCVYVHVRTYVRTRVSFQSLITLRTNNKLANALVHHTYDLLFVVRSEDNSKGMYNAVYNRGVLV